MLTGHAEPPVAAAEDHGALTRRVVDSIPSMLAYWDSSQRCRFANRAYERWYGVAPESLIGMHIRELLGPYYPLCEPYIEAALRGEAQEFEREIPDPGGGPPTISHANYIPDVVDGVVRGFSAQVTDVSALKRAERAHRESEQKFSGIIAIAADAIISVDADQRITIFNDSAERVFGYTKAEALGAPLEMLVPTRLRAGHRAHVAAFAASERCSVTMGERSVTIHGRRKSGEEFPAEATHSKLVVGGRVVMTVALRDITERRLFEREQEILADAGDALASSLDYAETIRSVAGLVVHHVADLCLIDMIEVDERGHRLMVVHADPAMAPICEKMAALPIDREHTLARSAFETKQPQLIREMGPELWASVARDDEQLRLIEALNPRSAIVVPLLSHGELLGAMVLASSRPGRYGTRDMAFATEIARRATSAIVNARLYAAAQRATKARDDILAIVAHDVRTPLSTILLATGLLERQLARGGVAAAMISVQTILRAFERANRLIQDLLDVARIEGGALTIERRKMPARQLLVDSQEEEQLLATNASIALRIDAPEELSPILGDRDRLLQVFENLVGNAIKFTPAGGSITLGADSRPGEVCFRVEDTGVGMSSESLARVFDRFWQAGRAERHGAGLGLPICKGIVEAHGGRIWAESELGRGTTFYFSVPTATVLSGEQRD
ncbi:MAG: PAS domain S-box protein [Deltaproteobacteria bacterium]|nr:PAS domain S-box protein [Deltaproteobacteria bacterium]MBP6830851.1 PAS domain S-box protein [Deltaproteobacteria bacterium]